MMMGMEKFGHSMMALMRLGHPMFGLECWFPTLDLGKVRHLALG